MRHDSRCGNNWHVAVAFISSALFLTLVNAQARSVPPAEDTVVATAAEHQEWARVQSLIQDGADVNADQPDGATALHWAAHWNDPETVVALIEAGAEVDAVKGDVCAHVVSACIVRICPRVIRGR